MGESPEVCKELVFLIEKILYTTVYYTHLYSTMHYLRYDTMGYYLILDFTKGYSPL